MTGAAIQSSVALLSLSGNPAEGVTATIPILLASSTFYIIACYQILAGPWQGRNALWFITVMALLFRLTLLPLKPELSEDLYRYQWEGRVQISGALPYSERPDDPRWLSLRDSNYSRIAGKDLRFGYGPLWVLVERGMAAMNLPLLAWKLPAVLADLGLIGSLLWLLRLHRLPMERILIYAWCPLPIVEFWHSGHNDALMMLCLVLALCCARAGRWPLSYGLLALATLVKFWPLLLFPLWLERSRRWKAALAAPLVMAPFAFWVWEPLRARADFLTGFLGGWRNNDSLFALILAASGGDPRRAKFLSLAIIGILALAVAAVRSLPLEKAALLFIAGMLLVSANVHPWYLTWVAPLLVLYPWPPLLLWLSLAPLSYQVLIEYRILGDWNGSTEWRWWIYLPVLGLFLGELLQRFRRKLN